MKPVPGIPWANGLRTVSKVLRICLSLYRENTTKIGAYSAAEQQKVRLIIVLGSVTQGLADVRAALIARGGSFGSHHWMFAHWIPW